MNLGALSSSFASTKVISRFWSMIIKAKGFGLSVEILGVGFRAGFRGGFRVGFWGFSEYT